MTSMMLRFALLAWVFSPRAQTTPMSQQRSVLFLTKFGILRLFSQGGEGTKVDGESFWPPTGWERLLGDET